MQNTGYQRIIGSLEKVSYSPPFSQGVSFHVAYMHACMPKYMKAYEMDESLLQC